MPLQFGLTTLEKKRRRNNVKKLKNYSNKERFCYIIKKNRNSKILQFFFHYILSVYIRYECIAILDYVIVALMHDIRKKTVKKRRK